MKYFSSRLYFINVILFFLLLTLSLLYTNALPCLSLPVSIVLISRSRWRLWNWYSQCSVDRSNMLSASLLVWKWNTIYIHIYPTFWSQVIVLTRSYSNNQRSARFKISKNLEGMFIWRKCLFCTTCIVINVGSNLQSYYSLWTISECLFHDNKSNDNNTIKIMIIYPPLLYVSTLISVFNYRSWYGW